MAVVGDSAVHVVLGAPRGEPRAPPPPPPPLAPPPPGPAIVWFRGHDLRAVDHAALDAAVARPGPVVALFVLEDVGARPSARMDERYVLDVWNMTGESEVPVRDEESGLGRVQRWYLHYSLLALREELRKLGVSLVCTSVGGTDEAASAVASFADAIGAGSVYWNRRYTPQTYAADAAARVALSRIGVATYDLCSEVLVEPDTYGAGVYDDFQSYTRFWIGCLRVCPPPRPRPALRPEDVNAISAEALSGMLTRYTRFSRAIDTNGCILTHCPSFKQNVADLGLLRGLDVDGDNSPGSTLAVGCVAVKSALARFLNKERFHSFADGPARRDGMAMPEELATSRLSTHIRFGEISPRTLFYSVLDIGAAAVIAGDELSLHATHTFIKNLSLREFSYHMLHRFPDAASKPIMPEFEVFPWARDADGAMAHAWRTGRTGFPIVDAAMRQLSREGWVHNRMRFLAASFFCKYLLLPWPVGARYMIHALVDGDEACNSLGWQWTVGCNSDSFPFSTLVNPLTLVKHARSSARTAAYVRKYVPELAGLPDHLVFTPWLASAEQLKAANLQMRSHSEFQVSSATSMLGPPSTPYYAARAPQLYPTRIVTGPEARSRARNAMELMRRIFSAQRQCRVLIVDQTPCLPEHSRYMHDRTASTTSAGGRNADREPPVSPLGESMLVDGNVSGVTGDEVDERAPRRSRRHGVSPSEEGNNGRPTKRLRTAAPLLPVMVQAPSSTGIPRAIPVSQLTIPPGTTEVESLTSSPPLYALLTPPLHHHITQQQKQSNLNPGTEVEIVKENDAHHSSEPKAGRGGSHSNLTTDRRRIPKRPRLLPTGECTPQLEASPQLIERVSVQSLLSPVVEPTGTVSSEPCTPLRTIELPVLSATESSIDIIAQRGTRLDAMSRFKSLASNIPLVQPHVVPARPDTVHRKTDAVEIAGPSPSLLQLPTPSPQALQAPPAPVPAPSQAPVYRKQPQQQALFPQPSTSSGAHGYDRQGRPAGMGMAPDVPYRNSQHMYPSANNVARGVRGLEAGVQVLGSQVPSHGYMYHHPFPHAVQLHGHPGQLVAGSPVGMHLPHGMGHDAVLSHAPHAGGVHAQLPLVRHGHPHQAHQERMQHMMHTGQASSDGFVHMPPGHIAGQPLNLQPHMPAPHCLVYHPVPQFVDMNTGGGQIHIQPNMQLMQGYPGMGMHQALAVQSSSNQADFRMAASLERAAAAGGVVPNGRPQLPERAVDLPPAGPTNSKEREAMARRMAAMNYKDDTFGGKHTEHWQIIAMHLLNQYEFFGDTDPETSTTFVRLCVLKDELRNSNHGGPRVTVNHCKEVFQILRLSVTGEYDRRGHGM